jgi:hypothetical protein
MADHHGVELTPVQRRRLESSCQIQQDGAHHIAYQHTVLCQTALPYRDPGNVRRWTRSQGAVSLEVEAGRARNPLTRTFEDVGLPYGSRPRLILCHLNSEALKHQSPHIEVEASLTAFVRRVQSTHPRGAQIRRFKDQLTCLAAAMVRLSIDLTRAHAMQVDTKIIDLFELWLTKDENQRVFWPAVIELSPRYFESLCKHAVPLDERAISALSNAPMALDVYAWLAQRLHRIPRGRVQEISWLSLYDQFGHGFARSRKFKESFKDVLRNVLLQYPAARIDHDQTGLQLRNSPPPVAARLTAVR